MEKLFMPGLVFIMASACCSEAEVVNRYELLNNSATQKAEQVFNKYDPEIIFFSVPDQGKKVYINPIYAIKMEGVFLNGKEVAASDSLILLEEQKILLHETESHFLYRLNLKQLIFEYVDPRRGSKLIEYKIEGEVERLEFFYRLRYSDGTLSDDLILLKAKTVNFH